MTQKTDEDEHSIEMQLSFLAKAMERLRNKKKAINKVIITNNKYFLAKKVNSRLCQSW